MSSNSKLYKCYICKKEYIPDYIVRIRKELYHINRYKQFGSDRYTDFCINCYNEKLSKILGDVNCEKRK